jgi:REP element-mobilizing transposase RayT
MARPQIPRPPGLHASAYGGSLRTRRRARGKRPISVRYSMHLVLRSSQARGAWSFARSQNRSLLERILAKHARAADVHIHATGNAGNHLHLRLRVNSKEQYFHFIRAVTGEIALKIKKIANSAGNIKARFWDRRPFSSIVATLRYSARLMDYIAINHIEGQGYPRAFARLEVQAWRNSS